MENQQQLLCGVKKYFTINYKLNKFLFYTKHAKLIY